MAAGRPSEKVSGGSGRVSAVTAGHAGGRPGGGAGVEEVVGGVPLPAHVRRRLEAGAAQRVAPGPAPAAVRLDGTTLAGSIAAKLTSGCTSTTTTRLGERT